MSTTTVSPTLRAALEARLQAIHDTEGITPWSEAEEKLRDLASALIEPYELEAEEMRKSEVDFSDRAVFGATVRAIEAAERVLVDRLAQAWSEAPTTLVEHPTNEQLRADLGLMSVG